jgi:predicted esterase
MTYAKCRGIAGFLCVVLSASLASARSQESAGTWHTHAELKYMFFEPPGNVERQGMLVLAHGRTGNWQVVAAAFKSLALKNGYYVLIPRSTLCDTPGAGHQRWQRLDLPKLRSLIELHAKKHSIPSHQIFWVAHSQGTWCGAQLAAAYPSLYGGFVGFGGGFIPHGARFNQEFKDNFGVYLWNGAQCVADKARGERTVGALTAMGVKTVYHNLVPNYGHMFPSSVGPDVFPWIQWLSARNRLRGILRDWTCPQAPRQIRLARVLIAPRAQWPSEWRKNADELALAIEKAEQGPAPEIAKTIDEISEAMKRARQKAQARTAVLSEFDRRMMSNDYGGARALAKSQVAKGGGEVAVLRGGEAVAAEMSAGLAAMERGAKSLIGEEIDLRFMRGKKTVRIKSVTDAGLTYSTSFTINGQTRERIGTLKWSAIHPEQQAEFAALASFKASPAAVTITRAYAALAAHDLAAAGRAVRAAEGHPLGRHLADVLDGRKLISASEDAMERARKHIATRDYRSLRAAVVECRDVLSKVPGHEEPVALLAKIVRLLAGPRTPAS